jgi:hypothetical protein
MTKTVAKCAAALIVALSVAAPLPGQNSPRCGQHPPVTRDEVVNARNAGHGIRQQYILDRGSRPPGHEVATVPDVGGGDCPAEYTPRGTAAAAVGTLLYNGELHCSAFLVTNTMILTAAHCIQGFDQNKLKFILGKDLEHPVQRSGIYSAEVHKDYGDGQFGVNDIAYAYLEYRMTEAVPLEIPDEILPRAANLFVLHVGYGIAGAQPGVRRCVNIPILDRCDDSFDYAAANMNTCNGDSGGAAFRDNGEKILLVGMTDWGDDACADFGVDVDIGHYSEWIQLRKNRAPRNFHYAPVESWARLPLAAGPDEVWAKLDAPRAEARFNSQYKGRWVTWDAIVGDTQPPNVDEIPDTCSVIATAGQKTQLLLHEYPGGCGLTPNSRIRFTGRLARVGPRWLDVVLAEPITATEQTTTKPVGEYVLSRLVTTTREVRERRKKDVRLESRHGSWSGRVSECLPISVEPPWRLDRAAPISFAIAYRDHADYLGAVQNPTDQSFCVPLWAEGYGGAQLFGATVDAGMVGVISGTVEFGAIRTEQVTDSVPIKSGPITNASDLNISLPTVDKYEVHVKLRDGKEQTFSQSGSLGSVAINWADGKLEVRSDKKQE